MRERGKGTWELRVYLGRDPVIGRDRYKTRTFKGGKRAAQEALALMVTQAGTKQTSEATFGHLVERWFATASVARDWSPKTILETRRIIDAKLGPLGPVPLHKLRTSVLDEFYATLRTRGGRCRHDPVRRHGAEVCELGGPLAAATVRRIHVVVHAALEQAVAWEWLMANPAAKASPGRIVRREIVPARVPQVLALVDAAERDQPDLAVFLVLAAVTGARRGEMCALRWSDIDTTATTVTFSRVISQGPEGLVERPKPKTRSSLRTISLDAVTMEVLAAHRLRCEERARLVGVTLGAKAFLFASAIDGSQPWRPDSTSRRFSRLRTAVGLDPELHLHSLRHFVVTTLLNAGVSLPQVAGRVGHGGGGHTTLSVYSHFQQAPDREAAELLARLLERPADKEVAAALD